MLDRIRCKLLMRGLRGFIGLHKQFTLFDTENKGFINLPDFIQGMKDFKLDIDQKDAETLFKMFDKQQEGAIEYDQFMYALSGSMSEIRANIINKAYDEIQSQHAQITTHLLKSLYHAAKHPDVKQSKKTIEEAIQDFTNAFEAFHNIYNKDGE